MTWLKLETTLRTHPKFTPLGAEACWLYVCAAMYAKDNLTDGFLPKEQVGVLYPFPRTSRLVRVLLWAKLWEETSHPSDGYVIHDYLDWNPSREAVLLAREEDAARKRKGKRSNVRRGKRKDSKARPAGIQT